MRATAVRVKQEIRERHRLAELQRSASLLGRDFERRNLRNGPHRSALQPLRQSSGPCVRGRAAADASALLHQWRRHEFQRGKDLGTTLHVMAGLVPAIHVLLVAQQTWMPGTSPGMTTEGLRRGLLQISRWTTCRKLRCWLPLRLPGTDKGNHYDRFLRSDQSERAENLHHA